MPPRSGARNPSMHSIVVVLPAPFGPMRPKISPSRTSRETLATATVLPYRLARLRTMMTGSGIAEMYALHEHRRRVTLGDLTAPAAVRMVAASPLLPGGTMRRRMLPLFLVFIACTTVVPATTHAQAAPKQAGHAVA